MVQALKKKTSLINKGDLHYDPNPAVMPQVDDNMWIILNFLSLLFKALLTY